MKHTGMIRILAVLIFLMISIGCDDSSGSGTDVNSGVNDGTDVNDGTGTNDGTELNSGTNDGTGGDTDLSKAYVVTGYGPVQGFRESDVSAFLGIPYAAPPVGDLRWAPPQEPQSWSEPLQATSFRAMCVQPRADDYSYLQGRVPLYSSDCPSDCEGDGCCVGSEDCLYLNVWTPARSPEDALPVLVWIHGGGFIQGDSANPWTDGARMAKEQGIVVVSMEYRLGVFGFLAHPDLSAEQGGHSGNYGILDQITALQWVRDNIARFGGDPERVTIVGESAGGWSVCILLTSPLAEGLFNRAIIESISCDDVYSMRRLDEPTPRSQAISAHQQGTQAESAMGCSDASDVVSCMRSTSVSDVLEALHPRSTSFLWDDVYKPIVDGYAIPEATLQRLREGHINATHVISGINNHEDAFWRWSNIFPLFGITSGYRLSYADSTPGVVDRYHESMLGWFGEGYYDRALAMWGDPETGSDAVVMFEDMLTDVLFNCGTRRHLRLMEQAGATVYRYVFTRVPPDTFAERERMGAVHASEIKYVFGNLDPVELYYRNLNSDDEVLASKMMQTWASFVAGEDPSFDGVSWVSDPDRVMHIDLEGWMGEDWFGDACDLVDEVRDSTYCTGAPEDMPWTCLF